MATEAIVVVDPISTGGCLSWEAKQRGYAVIAVWCMELMPEMRSHRPAVLKDFVYDAEINEQSTMEATAAAVTAAAKLPIAACIVGAESGVTLADGLSAALGVRTNGPFSYGDRRNKSVQQRAVKAAGLRAVREGLGNSWSEVETFVDTEPFPIVVKPVESAGSDGVKLCRTKAEAKDHFNLLMDSQRKCGAQGAAVLCQEFLKGKEYVVDHVSRDGVHKTVMIWVYDKRPTNGAAFVYYGMIPVDPSSPEAKILIDYTRGVLDALKIDNGPTHGEVMMTTDGPCLVEMNCRSHGWDGGWVPLAEALTGGYAQPGCAIDSHVNPAAFNELPERPPSPFRAAGQVVMLVSFFSGRVRKTTGYDRMRKLSSFVALQTGIDVGSVVELTVDLFTAAGVLVLANADPVKLAADLAEVRRMEKEGLFEFDEEVDPMQFEPSPDLVNPVGRRRSDSVMSEAMACPLGSLRDTTDTTDTKATLYAGIAGAFAAGALLGLILGRRGGR